MARCGRCHVVVKVFTSNYCVTATNGALNCLLATLVEVKNYVTSARTMKCDAGFNDWVCELLMTITKPQSTVLIRGKNKLKKRKTKTTKHCNNENFNTSVNSLRSRADKKLSCTRTGFLRGGANFLLS